MMHEELNYLGVNNFDIPNKNKKNEFNDFNLIFNRNNYSIISKLFYGTFKETKKCNTCNNINFNYQKFGLISFEMKKYSQKKFNIYDGFKDNEKPKLLSDNNKIYCNICKNLSDYQYYYKIIEPPSKLLININYDNNNENKPSKVEFDEIIDISKYINFSYKLPIKYRINFICSYLSNSINNNINYITFCWNKENKNWYKYENYFFIKCKKNEIYTGYPYLLLYEKI